VIFLVIESIFLLALLGLLIHVYLAASAKRWDHVEGKIVSINLKQRSHPRKRIGGPTYETRYIPLVTYEYAVNGKNYHGNRIYFCAVNMEFNEQEAINSYLGVSPGDSVTIYYHKFFPSISVVRPNESEFSLYIFLAGCIVAGMFAVQYYNNALH
jgi:hypothetical protein